MAIKLPGGVDEFLANAGWAGAKLKALDGDASFRRYFRVKRFGSSAMLMDAPPPQEDVGPFLRAARWLDANGMRVPEIYADDEARGLVLLEDLGKSRMRDYLDQWPDDEVEVYRSAVNALVKLHRLPPGPFLDYSISEYMREVALFTEWYCPARGLAVDVEGYRAAWETVLGELLPRQRPGVTVLRDYHAENIMLMGTLQKQGLLDFQDALVGHPAYDLVSLLQDARRDVSQELEAVMFDHYREEAGIEGDTFLADYARLGAQRNAKIVGIFVRLWKRDKKPRYLSLISRVWRLLERDLTHPALGPVSQWFDRNIPRELREASGGNFAL
jgi:aminoglycoside/choline kinase family phosphotransferase